MTDEQVAAHINAAAVVAFGKIQGMMAENAYCAACDNTPSYLEPNFSEVVAELEGLLKEYRFTKYDPKLEDFTG